MRELTYVDATLEALDSAMARDPSIFVVGEGIGERGGNFNTTVGLYAKYGPERLRDTPISERGLCRHVRRCGHDRYASCCRLHVLRLSSWTPLVS